MPVKWRRPCLQWAAGEKVCHLPPGWTCHIDLHETTDTDESEFRPVTCAVFTRLSSGWRHSYSEQPVNKCATVSLRPAKAARDGAADFTPGTIPDGFYLVADNTNPQVFVVSLVVVDRRVCRGVVGSVGRWSLVVGRW